MKCQICYNKNTNDVLKCKQCKNNICDVCFANIIFNNEKFNDNYMNNKSIYSCPYCKYDNVYNTKINNYNTNDKLIKLLIKQKNDKVDLFKNDIVEFNNTLMNELDDLKKHIYNLELELSNVKITNTITSNKLIKSTAKLNNINDFNIVKYSKIIDVLNNTKRKTILHNEISNIING